MNNLVLVVDIGNSTIVFGFFKDGTLSSRFEIPSSIDSVSLIEHSLKNFATSNAICYSDIKGGLICSVVPMYTRNIQTAISHIFGINIPIMDHSYIKDIKMNIDNPLEVGGDIAADIVAANTLFGVASVIIDLGTVSKFVVIDEHKTFIGTSFMPGIQSAMDSMREKTALLPGFNIDEAPKHIYGKNTIDSMRSGIYYSSVFAIREIVKQIEKEYGKPMKKIVTGGCSHLVSDAFKDYTIDKDFVLKGIYFIYKNN